MARDLQVINSSGELTEIKLGGTGSGYEVLTSDEIDTAIDTKIDLINESWGVITSASQTPDESMKVGDWMTSNVNEALTNFDGIVPNVGQRVYKTSGGWAVGAAATDFDYFAVPYSGARTDLDLGEYDISAANLTKLEYGVFASLGSPSNTTITTGGTYYPISGTFTNNPSQGFSTTADPAIQFDEDDYTWFEIDWHCTFSCSTSNSTISVGIGDTSDVYSQSVMQSFAKNADQLYQLSGTLVVALNQNDKIQLLITSDTSADVITVNNFTTTIKAFITKTPVVGP